jgi:hypothetical protein
MAAVQRPQSAPSKLAHYLFLGVIDDALGLAQRYQDVPGFRGYVRSRMTAVTLIGALMVVTSVGCAAATVLFLGGTRPALVLLAILLVPVVLVGSLFVQAYVFGAWLENRALAQALHHSPRRPGPLASRLRKAGIDLGTLPRVPWALAVLFLFLPLVMLTEVVPMLGFGLIALLVLTPFVYARLDR